MAKPSEQTINLDEIPALIDMISLSNLDKEAKSKITTSLNLIILLTNKLEHTKISLSKIRELLGINLGNIQKEV